MKLTAIVPREGERARAGERAEYDDPGQQLTEPRAPTGQLGQPSRQTTRELEHTHDAQRRDGQRDCAADRDAAHRAPKRELHPVDLHLCERRDVRADFAHLSTEQPRQIEPTLEVLAAWRRAVLTRFRGIRM